MKKQKQKQVSENAVAAYWDNHDATEVLDLDLNKTIDMIYDTPVQSISIRLPIPLLNRIKQIASGMDIAYQALIKVWLNEKARDQKSAKL